MTSSARSTPYWFLHYGLLAIYVAFALFPLYWLLKVSITPNDLLYSE
ncbi:MAG: carbohydrate ABC transporter permease, partial [Pseudomonadota bacterium]|nr:carbohydrate ABC transporter permease [Pseudomonadota bacterium]